MFSTKSKLSCCQIPNFFADMICLEQKKKKTHAFWLHPPEPDGQGLSNKCHTHHQHERKEYNSKALFCWCQAAIAPTLHNRSHTGFLSAACSSILKLDCACSAGVSDHFNGICVCILLEHIWPAGFWEQHILFEKSRQTLQP